MSLLKKTIKLTAPGSLVLLAAVMLSTPESRTNFLSDPLANSANLVAAAAGIFAFLTIFVLYFTWSAQGAQRVLRPPTKLSVETGQPTVDRGYSVIPTITQLIAFMGAMAVTAGVASLILPSILYAGMVGVAAGAIAAYKLEGLNLTVTGVTIVLIAALVQEEFYPSARDCDQVAWELNWLTEKQAEALAYWEVCGDALSEADFCYDEKPERTVEEFQSERRRLWWRLVERCGSSRGYQMPA